MPWAYRPVDFSFKQIKLLVLEINSSPIILKPYVFMGFSDKSKEIIKWIEN